MVLKIVIMINMASYGHIRHQRQVISHETWVAIRLSLINMYTELSTVSFINMLKNIGNRQKTIAR